MSSSDLVDFLQLIDSHYLEGWACEVIHEKGRIEHAGVGPDGGRIVLNHQRNL